MNEEYIITRQCCYLGEPISYKIMTNGKKLIRKVRRGEVETPIHIALKRFKENMSIKKNKIKDGQVFALNSLIRKLTGRNDRELRLYIVSELLDKEVKSTKNLTIDDWQEIRDYAYPNWVDNNWEACDEFREKVKNIEEDYLENELGYQKLL